MGLTVHKAKGLENKIIFFIDFHDIPPFWVVKDTAISELHEEARIAYVGVTRAEDLLYITSVGYDVPYWQVLKQIPNLETNVTPSMFEHLSWK